MALQKLLGIKWCHNVLNDDVRWTTKQLNFLAIAQVFCHSAQMPDETDLNDFNNWRRPPGHSHTR